MYFSNKISFNPIIIVSPRASGEAKKLTNDLPPYVHAKNSSVKTGKNQNPDNGNSATLVYI